MARLLRGPNYWAGKKPPWGATLDHGHPLCPRKACWLFNEGAAPAYDLVTGLRGSLGGGEAWTPAALGIAITNGTGTSDLFDTGGFQNMGFAQGTILWRVNPAFAFNDGVQRYFWGHQVVAGGKPEFTGQKFSDNNFYIGWNEAGGDHRVTLAASATNLVQNAWQMYAFTWSTTTGSAFFRNGISLGTNGVNPVTGAANVNFWINNAQAGVTNKGLAQNSATDYFTIYDTVLSQPALVSLFLDPWQFVTPRVEYRGYRTPGGVVAVKVPRGLWGKAA